MLLSAKDALKICVYSSNKEVQEIIDDIKSRAEHGCRTLMVHSDRINDETYEILNGLGYGIATYEKRYHISW